MKRYMVLLNAPEPASELMSRSTPEQMQASMKEWITWKEEFEKKNLKFEFGSPLQAVSHITPEGVASSDNQASGYFLIEADSLLVATDLLITHPHLKRPGATMDVLEKITMPGVSHKAS